MIYNFSPQYQCCFRKGYSAQHCLLGMIEKMKEPHDTEIECNAVASGTDAFSQKTEKRLSQETEKVENFQETYLLNKYHHHIIIEG